MGIPHYRRKFKYLVIRQNGLCPIAKEHGVGAKVNALHHRLHNTIENRHRFPLFIDSILNLVAVNNDWHINNGSWGKITEKEAKKYERFLRRHPKIAEWVNTLETPEPKVCSNCLYAVVYVEKLNGEKIRMAKCKKGYWKGKRLSELKGYKRYCPDYESMGYIHFSKRFDSTPDWELDYEGIK